MLGWLTQKVKESAAEAARQNAERKAQDLAFAKLQEQVEARFVGRVFIIPEAVLKLKDATAIPGMTEGGWDHWQKILERFPNAPRTKTEEQTNEGVFWRGWADYFTVTAGGRRELKPTNEMHNYYANNEKWVLREYFAATGKVIDPFVKQISQFYVDRLRLDDRIARSRDGSPAQQALENERRGFNQRSALMGQVEIPAHFDKWGEWFTSHIEDAFRQAAAPVTPAANIYGKGGFATLDDINRAQGRQGEPERRAQSQTFKD